MNPHAQVPSSTIEEEEIKKALFNNAMENKWEEVINIYKRCGETAHKAKITRSGDTAIHIAISVGLENVVESLVSSASATRGSLAIQNELGNTPLHWAASLGNLRMCKCIAKQDLKLIGIRNKDSETPFFLAVNHGRKAAFLCLHSFCKDGEGYEYCRKNDGETILHSAIFGEYFDIAFQIILLYEELLNSVNEQGFSPLHLLASKPSAFRSGSHIRGFRKLIYHCIFVDELEEESSCHTLSQELQYGDNKNYPENYQTCAGFVLFLRNAMMTLVGRSKNQNTQQTDAEDPTDQKPVRKQVGSRKKWNNQQADDKQCESTNGQGSSTSRAQGDQFFPENYVTCFHGLKFLSKAMLIILGLGSIQIIKLQEKKEKHIWSVQVMKKLLKQASLYEYEDNGRSPPYLAPQKDEETTPFAIVEGGIAFNPESLIEPPQVHDDHNPSFLANNSLKADQDNKGELSNGPNGNGKKERVFEMETRETPILIAAKNGIIEMVESILKLFPVAIHDMNDEKRNIVLLAVEHRQPKIYKFLLGLKLVKESIFRQRDEYGNSALHLAAMLGGHRPWLIPGAALQMQWELKWYEFVKNSMPFHFFARYNKQGQTPRDIFSETHKDMIKEGGEWLTNTSESCSVVAALIATVAFATSSTVPGGVNSNSGTPILEYQPAFSIFAISSLVALCFSVTAVVMFLSILTSRYQERDFGKGLPRKLLVGLTSLFVSIASMLVSFCAGHFFVLKEKLKYAAFPVYAVTCLPVTFFAVAQFPLYFDLIWATFKKVPQRSSK